MPVIIQNLLLIFCLFLVLTIVITVISHVFIPVPFIPTPKKVVDKILQFAEIGEGDVFYDLGAGDARILTAAKARFPSILAIGVEFIPTVWLLGKLRIFFSRKDVKLILGDARNVNLSNADCVFVYLLPNMMDQLEQKFDKELKEGTRIISYAFSFKNRKSEKEIAVPWLSGERQLRMYRWSAPKYPNKEEDVVHNN
ncbi:MAG: hypothetical protein KAS32_18360 [Candidatus Peribacteraceae bacterium]|nr:hypothetical protein [Candidatus Peribacteraceae bacterium]